MNEMLLLFLQIMLINIVLSGDNAIVIAMASQKLSHSRRMKAVRWGAIGAVVLRLVLTVIAVQLLHVPFIQAAGSLLLIYIAVKLLSDKHDHRQIEGATSVFGAIRTIIVADFVMSLDNVLAIAAIARGEMLLVYIGIALSIPLIVWGSTLIMQMLDRLPVLIYIGAALLGYTAGEMVLSDRMVGPIVQAWSVDLHRVVPLLGAIVVILLGLLQPLLMRSRHNT